MNTLVTIQSNPFCFGKIDFKSYEVQRQRFSVHSDIKLTKALKALFGDFEGCNCNNPYDNFPILPGELVLIRYVTGPCSGTSD